MDNTNTAKESFLIFKSFYAPIKNLSDANKGKLFDAIFLYQIEGIEPPENSRIYPFFLFFKNQFRLDNEKYQKRVEKNRKAAEKRWSKNFKEKFEAKDNANASNRMQKDAKHADNDNDNDNDKAIAKDKLLEAWNAYAPNYLKGNSIFDPEFISLIRNDYISKAKTASEKSVIAFIKQGVKVAPPDPNYVDFNAMWEANVKEEQ